MANFSPGQALLVFALVVVATALLAWPRAGLVARVRRRLGRSDAVLGEDVLKALYHGRASDPESAASAVGAHAVATRRVVARLLADGLVVEQAEGLALTDAGRRRALELVRAHRLWERFLADRTGVAATEWHAEAERQEHRLSGEQIDQLASRIGRPLTDPHGDPIPEAAAEPRPLEGVALTSCAPGTYEVVHLEDEPEDAYRGLLAAGLAPGEVIKLTGRDDAALRIELDGAEVRIGRAEGELVTVKATAAAPLPPESLAALSPGQRARVVGLSPTLLGPQRRRLLDLGFVPGTDVTAEFHSAMGEPTAFRVRGALIALRHEQAAAVRVEAA